MEATYRGMIDTFNAKKEHLTGKDISAFMHDTIIHNGKPTSRDEVAHGPATAFTALQNVQFAVEEIKVLDAGSLKPGQHNFHCTLVLKPVEGDKRSIQEAGGFTEAFTYLFRDGRIAESSTGLDIDAKKAEMMADLEASSGKA